MAFIVVGLSHKTAPLSLREKLALDDAGQEKAYQQVKALQALEETAMLFTCNRVEAYALASDAGQAQAAIADFLCRLSPGESAAVRKSLYQLSGEEAVLHLLKVASSLDSMVLGEAQILGQVKAAYEGAVARQTVGPFLHGLFHRVFRAAKDVRTKTDLGKYSASVPSVAVDLSKRIFNDLPGRGVLLIGAGEMGRLAAEHFQSAGVTSLFVANRSLHKAQEVARAFRGEALDLGGLADALAKADVALSSAATPGFLLGADVVERVLRQRAYKPLLLIDLSVPRSIDPAVAGLEHVYLYHLDHLQQLADEHQGKRLEAGREALHILGRHLQEIREWQAGSRLAPTIAALTRKMEELRLEELKKMRHKLAHLASEDFDKVDHLTKALINKVLNGPLSRLRDSSKKEDGLSKELGLLEELFDLKETPK